MSFPENNQPDQIPPDVMAYLSAAAEHLIKEQNVQFTSKQEFSNWFDKNATSIVTKAQELQFDTWIKFLELEHQHIELGGIYNNSVYTNAKEYFLEIFCKSVYKKINSNTHSS